ncbi:hypothetical protein DPMN_044340 [Dreissena polymorpha]|uniref:Nucleotide exchange factor GrpE n=1 Tax=Dreissena polymorpha TaxID=45954 RepID=A0A9D4D238_DREPO|nr:hypothetical protein DPMN_044340 [Dreissena polymorpha]
MNDDSEGTSTLTKKSSDKTEGQVEQLKELLVKAESKIKLFESEKYDALNK